MFLRDVTITYQPLHSRHNSLYGNAFAAPFDIISPAKDPANID